MRRPRVVTAPAAHQPIPSIFDLGIVWVEICTRQNKHDEQSVKAKGDTKAKCEAQRAFDIAEDQNFAIQGLIMNQPANTFADALALAIHGRDVAEGIDGEAKAAGIGSEVTQLRRAFARIALVLAKETGIRLDVLYRQPALISLDAIGKSAAAGGQHA